MESAPWWGRLLVTAGLLGIAYALRGELDGLAGGIVGGVLVHWLPPQHATPRNGNGPP